MRLAVVILIGAVLVTSLAVHDGRVSSPGELVQRLANRPEVATKFEDPMHGKFDAAVFLFTCIILTPLLAIGLVLAVGMVMMALEGTVFPLSRRIGVPDGLTVVLVTAVLAGVAWGNAELWLPRSLRLLGTIARAWMISTT